MPIKFQILDFRFQILNKFRSCFVFCFLFFGISVYGQCAMCRASLESTGQKAQAEAVNDGIVYLMIIPYILVGLIGIYIYRMYRNRKGK